MNENNNNNFNNSSNKTLNDSSNSSNSNTRENNILTSIANLFDDLKNGRVNWTDLINKSRGSRRLVLLVVFIALFFDNMLLTTVVPIIPEYLFELDHPNETAEFNALYKVKNFSHINNELFSYMHHNFNFTRQTDFTIEALIALSKKLRNYENIKLIVYPFIII